MVVLEDAEGIRRLTLNRPAALNAFDVRLFDEVAAALEGAAADRGLRCVALTGAGRAFSAGSDLGADAEAPEDDAPHGYDRFMRALETFPKPLVAAVNGLAVGIGVTMLGHCDLVLAGASARFRLPFTSLGLVPEAGSTWTLPVLLGPQLAAESFFTSRWISAEEAAEAGLVRSIVADDDLAERTLAVCREIAAMPVDALEATKRLLLHHRLPALAAREREDREFHRLVAGPAHAEALAAYREKRAPNFGAPAR